MCISAIEKHGASPANIQWTVVRGDSATLKIEFLDDDELTYFDTDGWTYLATSYDPSGDVLDDLEVVETSNGIAEIRLTPEITENWGTDFKNIVAEIPFDLQINIPGETVSGTTSKDTIWTPVIGTICVIGDISPRGSL